MTPIRELAFLEFLIYRYIKTGGENRGLARRVIDPRATRLSSGSRRRGNEAPVKLDMYGETVIEYYVQ